MKKILMIISMIFTVTSIAEATCETDNINCVAMCMNDSACTQRCEKNFKVCKEKEYACNDKQPRYACNYFDGISRSGVCVFKADHLTCEAEITE